MVFIVAFILQYLEAVLPRPAMAIHPAAANICADRHQPRDVNVSGHLSCQSRVQEAQARARFKEELYSIAGMILMMHKQMFNYIIVSMVQLN